MSRGGWASFGLLLPIGVLEGASRALGMPSLLIRMNAFANDSTRWNEGTPLDGWWVVWAYFWHAEHGILIAWGFGLTAAVVLIFLRRLRRGSARTLALWIELTLGTYGLLVLASTDLGTMAMFGRVARQMAPFLCLVTASAASLLLGESGFRRPALAAFCVAAAAQAALNFAVPFRMQFPIEIGHQWGLFQRCQWSQTLVSTDERLVLDRHRENASSKCIFVNPNPIWNIIGTRRPPAGRVILRLPHPLTYPPFQYEGYTAAEVRLIRWENPETLLVIPPGKETPPELAGLEKSAAAPRR